jgi:hypothetical protein
MPWTLSRQVDTVKRLALPSLAVFFEVRQRGNTVFAASSIAGNRIFSQQGRKKILPGCRGDYGYKHQREHEIAPFFKINGNYEKIILSMDRNYISDFGGIKNKNPIDFSADMDPVRGALSGFCKIL